MLYLCFKQGRKNNNFFKHYNFIIMTIEQQIKEITKEIEAAKIALNLPKNELQYSENRRALIRLKAEKRALKRQLNK